MVQIFWEILTHIQCVTCVPICVIQHVALETRRGRPFSQEILAKCKILFESAISVPNLSQYPSVVCLSVVCPAV